MTFQDDYQKCAEVFENISHRIFLNKLRSFGVPVKTAEDERNLLLIGYELMNRVAENPENAVVYKAAAYDVSVDEMAEEVSKGYSDEVIEVTKALISDPDVFKMAEFILSAQNV